MVTCVGVPVRDAGAVGAFVRASREAAGLTQVELAESAGVSRRWLLMVEGGHEGAELGRVFRVLRALGVHLETGSPVVYSPEERLVNELVFGGMVS
jgi:y4mF family transcriptional regulator